MSAEEFSARRVGTTLRDKWVLERLLGVGGMASVYVARHKIGRREAIKILHPEIARSEELRARFEQEARAVNAFQHPGVVEVRDVDVTEDGEPFLVMELLEGESLADRVRHGTALTVSEIVRIASEVLDVLAAAHERQIIHRDIKPDNVFLMRSGAVKVLDFGIARVRSAGGQKMATQAGVTLGTVAYMPPEQARGLEIDVRADLYAVGATAFRLLAGRRVHDATTDAELVAKTIMQPAPSLASVAPSVPAHVCTVVDRALAFERADRYPDARTMKGDLEAAGRGEAPPYATAAPPLPVHVPSVARGAGASNDAGRDAATFVPPAKRGSSSPPSADAVAATVPQPDTVPISRTIAASELRGGQAPLAPTLISRPVIAPSNEPTLLSGPPPAKSTRPPAIVYALAGFGALAVIAMVVLVVASRRAADAESKDVAVATSGTAPTAKARTTPTATPTTAPTATPTTAPTATPTTTPTATPTTTPTATASASVSPPPPAPTPTRAPTPAPSPTPPPAKPGKGKHGR